MNTKALLIVDVQNDFCPGGSLAVPKGDVIIPTLNKYIEFFEKKGWAIFASRDWHPKTTKHFKNHGGMWPEHCVEKSRGARFHSDLMLPRTAIIISKGADPDAESYSVFLGHDNAGCEFARVLDDHRVKELYIGGLATDYCIKASVLSALTMGLKVKLLTDAIAGVNLKKDDSSNAIKEMVARGAEKFKYIQLKE